MAIELSAMGQRLRLSRESLRLTLREVQERTGIGESSLSEFENGKREPRMSQLAVLGDLYRRPWTFFFEADNPPDPLVLWRQQPSPDVAAQIAAQFRRLCEQYRNLELWCDDVRKCRLPEPKQAPQTFADAERLAHAVHGELGLGERPGRTLLTVLEEVCGVKVFHIEYDPPGAAACTRSANFGPAILLNAKNARWRRNFDLAHELFHLITWQAFRTEAGTKQILADQHEEKLANAFASHLLMPADTVRLAIEEHKRQGTIELSALLDIARQFDVSIDALCWRMVSLRYLDREAAPDIIERCKLGALRWEWSREGEPAPVRPERFRALAVRALYTGRASIGTFAEYLGISRHQALRFAEREEPDEAPIAVADP